MTITNQQCIDWGKKLREQVEKFYAPRIAVPEKLIEQARAEGRDPATFPVYAGAGTVNLYVLLERIREAKGQATTKANEEEQKCQDGAVPNWVGDTQKGTDIALTIVMLPFVALTQNYAAAHLDLGEIYKGQPLGGDGALIPKARTDVLDALRIGGDTRKFLENPVGEAASVVKSGVEGVAQAVTDFLKKPFGG